MIFDVKVFTILTAFIVTIFKNKADGIMTIIIIITLKYNCGILEKRLSIT